MRQILLLSLFLLSCTQEKESNQISVILTPDKLELNSNLIDKKDFEKELKTCVQVISATFSFCKNTAFGV